MLCVMDIVDMIPEPQVWRCVCSFGFEKERQTTEILAALQFLLAKSHEWKNDKPVDVFNGDVYRAFEYLTHELAQTVMLAARWPPCVRAVIQQSNIDLKMTSSLIR